MRRAGFSLIETLVLLAVLGALLAVAAAYARPDDSRRAAESLRSAVLWGRANAIWRGVSVAVTEAPAGGGFVVRAAATPAAPCGEGTELASVRLSQHPGVRLEAGLPRGLVWLADGSGRSCDGGGVISATVRFVGPRRAHHVVVSSLGRVRIEQVDP